MTTAVSGIGMNAYDDVPPQMPVGKAAVLESLRTAGFRVPEFLISPSDLTSAAEQLGFPLIVRSAASVEDGGSASFAGLFRSIPNVRSVPELEDAVRACHASLHTPAAHDYCKRHGLDVAQLRMDVLVQRMIEPTLAGVAFTVNPMTGAEEIVVEACAGRADALLASQTPPLGADHPLLVRYTPIIRETAHRILRHFGAPQDIEFAIADDLLYVVQARPITRIHFAPPLGEWTTADFRDGGVSSRVCSPLMWSLYDFVWEHNLKASLREIGLLREDFQAGRLFFGRPYWNLGAVKNCLSQLPGYVEREFDADLSVAITYAGDGRCTPWTLGGAVRAIPTLFAVRRFLSRQETEARDLAERGVHHIEELYEPGAASKGDDMLSSFRRLVERDYFDVEGCYFRTIFALSLAKQDFKTSFPNADYASLVAALPPLQHMAPARAMRSARERGDSDIGSVVRKFRHHSRHGLDVMAPRWDEDGAAVEAMLSVQPKTNADPEPRYLQARSQALCAIPFWRRRAFNRKLDRLRAFVWLREELRDLSSRMYYLIRRMALALAEKHGLGDDVFFMSFREIFELDGSNVARNRETYESFRNFAAPNEIGARYPHEGEKPQSGDLRGIGASPGIARGRAPRARPVHEALAANVGDILVCPFTDPGWTPVLGRVAGIVTETGGLLSHAAVICREYGIPAVLGVPDAMQRIRARCAIVVHGSDGYITLGD
jgi:phosphohistidine swiveling domain-containing protein